MIDHLWLYKKYDNLIEDQLKCKKICLQLIKIMINQVVDFTPAYIKHHVQHKMGTNGSKIPLPYIFYMYLYSYDFCIFDKIFILNAGNNILLLEVVRILLGWNVTAVALTEAVQLGSSCFDISTRPRELRHIYFTFKFTSF